MMMKKMMKCKLMKNRSNWAMAFLVNWVRPPIKPPRPPRWIPKIKTMTKCPKLVCLMIVKKIPVTMDRWMTFCWILVWIRNWTRIWTTMRHKKTMMMLPPLPWLRPSRCGNWKVTMKMMMIRWIKVSRPFKWTTTMIWILWWTMTRKGPRVREHRCPWMILVMPKMGVSPIRMISLMKEALTLAMREATLEIWTVVMIGNNETNFFLQKSPTSKKIKLKMQPG
mmetsp:Transcript_12726/g.26400  ORF Transcript_12726/g.26400 Transcript_12726/m.26400 type:complete len:223 (-) Transcript_12726:356-1024(-)